MCVWCYMYVNMYTADIHFLSRYAINVAGRGLWHFRALLWDYPHSDWPASPGLAVPYELFIHKLQRKAEPVKKCAISRKGRRKPRYYPKKCSDETSVCKKAWEDKSDLKVVGRSFVGVLDQWSPLNNLSPLLITVKELKRVRTVTATFLGAFWTVQPLRTSWLVAFAAYPWIWQIAYITSQRNGGRARASPNMSGSGDQDIRLRYEGVCAELNMDEHTTEKAWSSYTTINNDYVLEVS